MASSVGQAPFRWFLAAEKLSDVGRRGAAKGITHSHLAFVLRFPSPSSWCVGTSYPITTNHITTESCSIISHPERESVALTFGVESTLIEESWC